MADHHRPSSGTGHASDFYMACREGDLDRVNRILKTLHPREINNVEDSNGSTALHAAAFFGHPQVVKRLLEVGASVYTHNRHGLTPEQEAKTEEIRNIFEEHKKSKKN